MAASTFSYEDASIDRRLFYNQVGWHILQNNWLSGIGLLQFIPYLANNFQTEIPTTVFLSYLQPIHNLWLLIAVEGGIFLVGLLVLIVGYALRNTIQTKNILAFTLLIQILLLSLVDHYFWTLFQGQLLFWFVIMYANTIPTKSHQ
jgi:O-antigen ligase